jgi:DNA-binding NtrC family response regulator
MSCPFRCRPLRERREDIPLLADYFVQQFNERSHKTIDGISTEALTMLESYDWPGNVRELQNAIEGAFSLTDSGLLTSAVLPAPLIASEVPDAASRQSSFAESKRDFERLFVLETLERCEGNVSNAAAEGGPAPVFFSAPHAPPRHSFRFPSTVANPGDQCRIKAALVPALPQCCNILKKQ